MLARCCIDSSEYHNQKSRKRHVAKSCRLQFYWWMRAITLACLTDCNHEHPELPQLGSRKLTSHHRGTGHGHKLDCNDHPTLNHRSARTLELWLHATTRFLPPTWFSSPWSTTSWHGPWLSAHAKAYQPLWTTLPLPHQPQALTSSSKAKERGGEGGSPLRRFTLEEWSLKQFTCHLACTYVHHTQNQRGVATWHGLCVCLNCYWSITIKKRLNELTNASHRLSDETKHITIKFINSIISLPTRWPRCGQVTYFSSRS